MMMYSARSFECIAGSDKHAEIASACQPPLNAASVAAGS